jgi:hypothetical protein
MPNRTSFDIPPAPMAAAERTEAAGPTAGGNPSVGVMEWLWRSHALDVAKAAPRPSTLRRERLRRSRLAAELADRAVDPAEPLRDGSSLPLAISLYREAAYWGLLAHSNLPGSPSLAEVHAAAQYPQPLLAADELGVVRSALLDKTFVDTAGDRPEILCREADLLQAFVHALINSEIDEQDKVATVLIQRWVRVAILLFFILCGLFAATLAVRRGLQGPDLALGKPWRASSRAFECHPHDMECGGAHSAMFFHTTEEEKPWLLIDLGAPTEFARVEVVNREDCCIDRAVPLVLEVGDDETHFREVARNPEAFRDWEATFAPLKARYVRLRVDRRSILHLVRVSVRAH